MAKEYILCVDDDRTILMSLKAQLRHLFGTAYCYEVAQSAAEAWEIIDEIYDDGDHIAIVISDWLMPEMKGDEFLIGVHQKHPDIVKIMLTGQADPDAVQRTEEQANLECCLSKPWTLDELKAAIPGTDIRKIS
ncbi:response regulator [Litoribacillus peritrichatus]|uniref:Response regulator n=1 Tax=Litoribacillus peritrichatus TaxID=718191 RepID=A0ABP7MNR3_9GAMM